MGISERFGRADRSCKEREINNIELRNQIKDNVLNGLIALFCEWQKSAIFFAPIYPIRNYFQPVCKYLEFY